MGIYLNPGKDAFEEAINSDIFIDKTEMIHYLNRVARTEQKYVCVSRPRRFGKSMAANMICAYYDREADSRALFEKCRISKVKQGANSLKWDEYLGRFDVIRLVMTDFFKKGNTVDNGLAKLQKLIMRDLVRAYPDVDFFDRDDLLQSFQDVYSEQKTQFVIVIDEWDAVFREYKDDKEGQEKYVHFLRNWLKDKVYVALAYMTGILPIKKFGKHSDLNMFDEYSMTNQMQF
ncbi:MAG: AAA family ATPase, partial [Clostridia bacterium]|nr:AAA family ATPase [Clostridia bacterium]